MPYQFFFSLYVCCKKSEDDEGLLTFRKLVVVTFLMFITLLSQHKIINQNQTKNVFFQTCDVQKSVFIQNSLVSTFHPPVQGQIFTRLVLTVQVAHHDVATPHQDLALTLGVGVRDPSFVAGEGLSHAAELESVSEVAHGMRSGCFGHTEELQNRDIDAEKVLESVH